MSIGQNVKRLRKEKKISATFIGKAVGKGGRQWVYDLEKGIIKRLTEDDIEKLAEILSVTVNELREKDETKEEKVEFYSSLENDEFTALKGFKERYYFLLEENRRLWKENSYLKSLSLKHKIDVYNTDNQNDTP